MANTDGAEQAGVVKWFNDARGFGFVVTPGQADIFVHYSVIEAEGYKTLREGQRVAVVARETDKGLCATWARVVN